MKLINAIIFLYSHLFFGQNNDLKIEIINDTIKKVSYYDNCKIVYSIKNLSLKPYVFILDSDNFNESEYEPVDSLFVGLPDYHLYNNETEVIPNFSFGSHDVIKSFDFKKHFKPLNEFTTKYSSLLNHNEYDIKIAFRILQKIVIIKPGEEKVFWTRVNFPDYRMRYYEMKNKERYFFQISLYNPKEISKGLTEKILDKDKNYTVFEGRIKSNKVPLVFEVYDGAQ